MVNSAEIFRPGSFAGANADRDEGVVGSAREYPAAKVGGDGRARVTTDLALQTPTTGSYFVVVQASAANNAVTVACGNLAAPTL